MCVHNFGALLSLGVKPFLYISFFIIYQREAILPILCVESESVVLVFVENLLIQSVSFWLEKSP